MARIEIIYHRQAIAFRVRDFTDLVVAAEVFLDEVYRLDLADEPRLILDFGSHIGLSVLCFHARFPSAHVHGFEPDPDSFQLLVANTRGVPNVSVHNVAVGASERTAQFFPARRSWVSSLVSQDPVDAGTPVEVKSIPTLLMNLGTERADLIKLDVEGAEWEILEAGSLDRLTDFVVGELHAHGAPEAAPPSSGLCRLGAFTLEVRQNDDYHCVFVARRIRANNPAR